MKHRMRQLNASLRNLPLILFLLAPILGYLTIPLPEAVPAHADKTLFSAERALKHYQWLARSPRPAGSQEHRFVRERLVQELTRMGLNPALHTSRVISQRFRSIRANVTNIVAVVPGRKKKPALLLMAHYDSVPFAHGAGDDGAGVITLLETARILTEGPQPEHDVILLLTDAEEMGLLGAEAFVRDHPRRNDIGLVINLEARGSRGPAILFQTSHGNQSLIPHVAKAVPYLLGNSLSEWIYRKMPNSTDLEPFLDAGFPALNVAFIGSIRHYHSGFDRPEAIDPRSIQHLGEYAVHLIHHFDRVLPVSNSDNDSYFFTFYGKFVHYNILFPKIIAIITGIFYLLWILSRVTGSKRSFYFYGKAGVILLIALISAYVFGKIVLKGIEFLHASLGSGFLEDHPVAFIIHAGFLSLLLVSGLLVFIRRDDDIFSGVVDIIVSLWSVLAIVTPFVFPEGHFLFLWPVLGFFAGEKLCLIMGIKDNRRTLMISSILAFIVTSGIWTPILVVGVEAMTFRMLPQLVFMITFTFFFYLPLFEPEFRQGSAHSLTGMFGAGFVLTILYLVGIYPFPHANPQTGTLNYLQLEPDHRAWWVVKTVREDLALYGIQGEPHRILDLATISPFLRGRAPNVETPPLSKELIRVEFQNKYKQEEITRLRWRVIPLPSTAVLVFLFESSPDLLVAEIDDGDLIPVPLYRHRSLTYVQPPREGFDLILTVRKKTFARFWIFEYRPHYPLAGVQKAVRDRVFIYRPLVRWPSLIVYRMDVKP